MLQQIDSAIGFVTVMLLLSLVITAVVQMVTAALDLRGQNLRLGIVKLLKQIVPELRKFSPAAKNAGLTLADEVAKAIVTHPSLEVGLTRLKAIRADELIKILDDLASDAPMQPDAVSEDVRRILRTALSQASERVRKIEHDVNSWFDTIMDRTSDSFVRHTRITTIAVAAVIVFAVQIDAGAIWRQISTSPELRANLLKLSDSAASQADRILAQGPPASLTLQNMATNRSNADEVKALTGAPRDLIRCEDGLNWVRTNVPSLSKEFSDNCAGTVVNELKDAKSNMQVVSADFSKTQVGIVYPGLQIKGWDTLGIWGHTLWQPAHFLGVLVSVILLSFGAPFWFNTLQQLANLKPSTASKIQKESADGTS
jgi:ElaB/YqjD/DUF883 family membrane-anchored ribosome-binding protein